MHYGVSPLLGLPHFSPFTIRHSFHYKTDKLASNVDLTYRLPCIVRPPALMPGQEVLSIFPSVYFTFLWGFSVFVFLHATRNPFGIYVGTWR